MPLTPAPESFAAWPSQSRVEFEGLIAGPSALLLDVGTGLIGSVSNSDAHLDGNWEGEIPCFGRCRVAFV